MCTPSTLYAKKPPLMFWAAIGIDVKSELVFAQARSM